MNAVKSTGAKVEAERKVIIIDNNEQSLDKALELKEYANVTRLVSVDGNVLRAVSVAYKTASGLHSEAQGQITKCIYSMSKLSIALLIVTNDGSDKAFDSAAFEIARDAFVSGKLEERANVLAMATGRAPEACYNLINRKLALMNEQMNAKTNLLTAPGESAESPEAITAIILQEGGKFAVSLPTGDGKTSKINNPVIQHYLDAGKKVLVISHRRSINKNAANMEGIVSYDECDQPDDLENAKGLKIVVNSLSNLRYRRFIRAVDLVVIDEASQVISHVLGGEVKNRQAVWDTLNFVVKNTVNVIFSDADIDSRCVTMLGECRLFRKAADHSKITVRTGDINHVRALAVEAATGRKADPANEITELAATTVLIACDVVKEAMALAKAIEKNCGPKALVITADNARWPEQAAFIANPNSDLHRVVIYSPVITSALSITSGHFKSHFGIFQGQIVPGDAIQMLRRDRTAETFVVGIKQPQYNKLEAVELAFKNDEARLEELLAGLTIDDAAKDKIRSVAFANVKLSEFQCLEYTHRSQEAWMRDNIRNTLPASLIARGFNLEVLEHNEVQAEAGSRADGQARKAVKNEIATKLINSAKGNEALIRGVVESGSANEEEHLQAVGGQAVAVMKVSDFNKADARLWGGGEGEAKIVKYRKLHHHFHCDEYVESSAPKVLSLLKPAVQIMSETNDWAGDDSVALFEKLNAIRSDVISSGIRIGSAKSDQAKKADITKIFAQFGLNVKRRERTKDVDGKKNFFYVITTDSLAQMNRYI
ncbi:DEAD/DEAH box helicase [Pseudomonas sp. ANT_J12]|uniref:Replication protein RepA n=1 Tax=Pseudomonas prosekii TaxID=1148509 RepID=A0A2U2D1B4_9PSED|nr:MULTISPECIES: DEAD/DEAH box helicase family protein [Pseudomonas]KAA0984960.1 DEAD/DEAH box helicase [Pseudomonas sp. ANT_J12]PWE39568.1 replication protein RepA [Pseudomonas prosekii]